MRVVLSIIVILCVAIGLFFIFIYSGTFNVSARAPDLPGMDWVLSTVSDKSVEHRAASIKVVPQSADTAQQLRNGHALYVANCIFCHGAPGTSPSKIGLGLNPFPPPLSTDTTLALKEIFWIADNGIKMTGMPSFGISFPDSTIWAGTHFVKAMQKMSAKEFTEFH